MGVVTDAALPASQSVIPARAEQGFVQQVRGLAACVIVLARRRIGSGYCDVRALDPAGRS